jgi:hypothetical protein
MKGRAPNCPSTFQAEDVMNPNPNLLNVPAERVIRVYRIKTVIRITIAANTMVPRRAKDSPI